MQGGAVALRKVWVSQLGPVADLRSGDAREMQRQIRGTSQKALECSGKLGMQPTTVGEAVRCVKVFLILER